MKNISFLIGLSAFVFFACKKSNEGSVNPNQTTNNAPTGISSTFPKARLGADYSQPITIDLANQMIQSYLTSINYPANDSTLISLSFDADTLRSYLNDESHGRIVTLQLKLAHQPQFVESNYGQNAGLDPRALTLILVGLNENDQYVYNRNNMVYEHFQPCPLTCNTSATFSPNGL